MSDPAVIRGARIAFHKQLLDKVLTIDVNGVPSNADIGSRTSIRIASEILKRLGTPSNAIKMKGQTSGKQFEDICLAFLQATFQTLAHLRPGDWEIIKLSQGNRSLASFEQYGHLSEIAKLCSGNPQLATMLGNDYMICPDIVIVRNPESDEKINGPARIVDDGAALLTSIRAKNGGLPLIHASISCKFTMRSDRAQNARSEALNLIRSRKGRTPHIAFVTAEPLPSRLASLALGTGDIDCVYHFALSELQEAVGAESEESQNMLKIMVDGKRLKDISDLPLDLVI